jgi:hypothetical protein
MDENDDLTELAAILSGMGGYDEELSDLDQQIVRAQKLRDRTMSGGTQAGRVFVADSPLEALSVIGDKWAGRRDEKAARASKTGVLGKQQAGRKSAMDALLKRYGVGATQPAIDVNYDDELMG